MQDPSADIQNREDVRTVVHAFYDGMEEDAVLGSYFGGLEWRDHLQKMLRFWTSIVLQEGGFMP